MAKLHVITVKTKEGRGRLAGEYTDEQFQGLPYIKEYGYLPGGYQAVHLDTLDGSCPKVRALREMPVAEHPGYPYRVTGELALRWERNDRRDKECLAAQMGTRDPLTGNIIGGE